MADYSFSGADFGLSGGSSLFGGGDAPKTTAQTADGGGYVSGSWQALAALGTGYLARRLDVDIATRVQEAGVLPTLQTTQNGVVLSQVGVPQPGGVGAVVGTGANGATTLNLSALLPFLIVGGLVFAAARMGG